MFYVLLPLCSVASETTVLTFQKRGPDSLCFKPTTKLGEGLITGHIHLQGGDGHIIMAYGIKICSGTCIFSLTCGRNPITNLAPRIQDLLGTAAFCPMPKSGHANTSQLTVWQIRYVNMQDRTGRHIERQFFLQDFP